MRTNHLVFFFVGLLICSGCGTTPAEKDVPLAVLDLEEAISKQVPDTFTWNGIAKRITYVPVSTSPDELFASIKLVHVGEEGYCMVDYKTNTIFSTDKNGKIVHSFCKKGQGPGEYTNLSYVYVNSEDATIRIFDQMFDKYIIYDLKGNLVQEISLKEKEIGIPLLISNDYVVARGRGEGTSKLCVADKGLNINKRLFPLDTTCTDMERLVLLTQVNWCQNRDLAIVNYANEDTVFSVTPQGVQPFFVCKKGSYRLPDNEASKMMELTPDGSPYIRTMRLASIPGYYLVSYLLKNCLYDEVWRKSDNQIVSRFSNESGEFGFPFSFPSGKKLRINFSSLYVNGNTVALFIPAAVAAEEKLADVDEDDNPVLVVMEL